MSRIEPTDKPPFGTHANSVYSTKFCNEEYQISASNISCSTSDIQSYVFKQDIMHVFFYCRFLRLSASIRALFLSFEIHWLEGCAEISKRRTCSIPLHYEMSLALSKECQWLFIRGLHFSIETPALKLTPAETP